MLALPKAVAREYLAAFSRFHKPETTVDDRCAIVAALLSSIRQQYDPNVSIWDLLPCFDKEII